MTNQEYMPSHAIPVVGYRSRKAAQICAYFAQKADGTIEKLKLIKLVYLAERRFIDETNYPMLFDEFYALKNGPICSSTLNGINGVIHEAIWSEFVARNGNLIVALRKLPRGDYNEISDAEIDTLNSIWKDFGSKTASQLVNYTHKHCPEYIEVNEGRLPISYKDVYQALGKTDAEELDDNIESCRRAEALLAH